MTGHIDSKSNKYLMLSVIIRTLFTQKQPNSAINRRPHAAIGSDAVGHTVHGSDLWSGVGDGIIRLVF